MTVNILILFVVLFNLPVYAEPSSPKEIISQIGDQFFKTEQIKDFDTASELFHYPSTYSPEERAKDKIGVRSVLEYFNQSFGKILSYKIPENTELYLALSIGGGDLPYWAKHPTSIRITYEVRFSNDGQGYVIIDLCKINDNYEIRSVHYGLPASRKDCPKRIQEIYDGMMKVLKALEQPNTKTV